MTAVRFRSLGALLWAILCVVAVGLASVWAPALAPRVEKLVADVADVALRAGQDLGWIMSGTGQPDPTVGPYLDQVLGLYLNPSPLLFTGQQTFPGFNFQGVTTPEQFCPFVCLPPPNPQLNFGDSLTQGVADLHDKIMSNADGSNVVFGYSQSATIATIEMQHLAANLPTGMDAANQHFVLIGDPNNPVSGILTRFDFPDSIGGTPQHLPFVNIPLSIGATPTDPFPTDIYTGDYDGWASFPEDPTNILGVINALIGIQTVHPYYPDPTSGVNLDVNDITDLGTIGSTHFYNIFAPLPLLAFMYDGGPAGRFFYDMFAPSLALGINWSYGNPGDPFVGVNGVDAIGPWQVNASGDLMASTAAGFFPKMDPLQMLAGMQWAGVQSFVGPVNDLLHDIGQAPLPQSLVDSLLSGYNFTNEVDQFLLSTWNEVTAAVPFLGPDAVFNGAPLIPGEPLLDLVGLGFSLFNL